MKKIKLLKKALLNKIKSIIIKSNRKNQSKN